MRESKAFLWSFYEMRILNLTRLATFALSIFVINVEANDPDCESVVPQAGRNAPEYVGMEGFLIPGKFWAPRNYTETLPKYPWSVPILEQTGPRLWGKSSEKLPAKTKVIVKAQHLTHKGFGNYSGILEVQLTEQSKTVRVDVRTFTPAPYWKCSAYSAANYGPFIAEILPGVRPVDRDGRWADVGEERKVFCNKRSPESFVKKGVECTMYRQYRRGFGGKLMGQSQVPESMGDLFG